MPASMTAYAVRETSTEVGTFTWELRAVNHRYLDVQPRLPETLRALEPEVRERVGAAVGRGRVECMLRFTPADRADSIEVDEALVSALVSACHTIDAYITNPDRLYSLDLLRYPGVVRSPEPDREALSEPALDLLDSALDELAATREEEGRRLKSLLLDRCERVSELVAEERRHADRVSERLRERLLERLRSLEVDVDEGRMEQELAYQLQKLDVSEELDRLDTHIDAIRDALDSEEPVGRRLDFLMQELHREANTLGSKSADAERSQASVELKVLIEQMREQVQNLE
ncbi:MAG: YicC/YloC family endoribonuclease [Halofilum sp. (in: g-proteobacteria)]